MNTKQDQQPLMTMPLAQAYTPIQMWEEPYPPEEGTRKGTIFPSLYRPYVEKGA